MVKILALGDFHGKLPVQLIKKIKSEKPDLIVSVGDYFPFYYKKLFFKHSYGKDVELWEVIGKKKLRELINKDLKKGEELIKKINNLPMPVISVIGNSDYARAHDCYDIENVKKGKTWKWEAQDFFSRIIRKYSNIKRFDYGFFKFKNLIFIGAYGHSFPGYVKSKSYKKYKIKLDKLFEKFKKENKKGRVIFVFHNMPYNCKLDKIRDKSAPEIVRGKHYGSKLIRRVIDKHQPVLGIGGHLHENQGKCNIFKTGKRKTIVVNSGAACEGKAAIIEFDEKKGKVKSIRFIE